MDDTTRAARAGALFTGFTGVCLLVGNAVAITAWIAGVILLVVYAIKDEQRDKERERTARFIEDAARRAREEEQYGTDRDIF